MPNRSARNELAHWIFICGAGELTGMAAAASVYLLVWSLWGKTLPDLHGLLFLFSMMFLGWVEGMIAGYFQWGVLSRRFPALALSAWVKRSAIGTAAGCLAGTMPSILLANQFQTDWARFDGAHLFLACVIGMVLGGVIGLIQWLELRKHSLQAGYWILANGLAWPAAVGLLYWGAAKVACTLPSDIVFGMGAAFGFCSGLLFGIISGLFLPIIRPADVQKA